MIIDSRYEVLKKLGTGLLATVFKVKDIRSENIYALKLFKNIDSKRLYEKFSAENMHHITKIQHPNLVHVIDFGNHEKHIYYISEYCLGKNLNMFRLRVSNIDFLYDIIVQTCYALTALHSQGIIHQDLKPANIMYRIKENETELKVMDYGFTKIDVERKQHNISYSLPFIAPEIYLNQGAVPQSDFYSLGVILYKITTGVLPYSSEQISGFIAGNAFNLLPKFPRELNKDIPPELGKLIIRLLEKNPEDRYVKTKDIIAYINQTRHTNYPYSRYHSIINNIKFSDYLVRGDYAHKLLEYVPIIESGNGKVIVLKAGKGLGKTNTISLFRYHILNDKYYTFDYECSPNNKDPFFALIKEFYFAAESNSKIVKSLGEISQKLQEYLFESEDSAFKIKQGKQELALDINTASEFLFRLSAEKPLIFTIRAGEYLNKDVITFLNKISNELTNLRIMVIVCINDPRKIQGLIHPVEIVIEPLTLKETEEYVGKLLNSNPPKEFVEKLWYRSNGNPMFIENILIDLTKKKEIWNEESFIFNVDWDKYELPMELKIFVDEKMEHLLPSSSEKLKKLAVVRTPLTKDLIRHILDIDDKELFFFIRDCITSEVLWLSKDILSFTFNETKLEFLKYATKELEEIISFSVIKYYHDKRIHSVIVLEGIIEHAEIINDIFSIKRFNYQKLSVLVENTFYEEAFLVICEIVQLNFTYMDKIEPHEKIRDYYKLLELSEWSTDAILTEELKKSILRMNDYPEKNMIIGTYYLERNKYSLAKARMEKALASCISGRLRVNILIQLGKISLALKEYENVKKIIDKLEKTGYSEDLYISIVILKASYLLQINRAEASIELLEEFIPTINTGNDANYFVKLGKIHNLLAVSYRQNKNFDESIKNYQIARKIWEKVKYKRKLGTIYNNLGDISLIQGDTNTALNFFDKAMKISVEENSSTMILLTNLNFGETYIKLGQFTKAEDYLMKALVVSEKKEDKPFYDSIINNLASAKSKTYSFNYYYSFMKEHAPQLLQNEITEITPLVKSYFYYLHAIGDYEKISVFLKRYESIFVKSKEFEFVNQMHGLILHADKKFHKAKMRINQAYKFSKKTQSVYAQMISFLRLNECFLDIGEIEKSKQYCLNAQELCKKYNFFYWEQVTGMLLMKTDLADSNVNLRLIIRRLLSILEVVKNNHFFQLELEIYGMLTQIYSVLKVKKKANFYFTKYKMKIENVAANIPKRDREKFYHKTKYYLNEPYQLSEINIVTRSQRYSEWEEDLYSIVKINEIKRIRFFIDKIIHDMFTPYYYATILFDELKEKSEPFLADNIDTDTLYSKKFRKHIQDCMDAGKIRKAVIHDNHVLFLPLKIRSTTVGVMVIADNGELEFQRYELNMAKTLRLHLTALLLRINDFAELNTDMNDMHKLVIMTQRFFSIMDTEKLNQEVIAFTMDFINASRGFLISKDENENYIYDVAMDNSNQIFNNYSFISKDVISEVQRQQKPVFIDDIRREDLYENYSSLDAEGVSIYCAPIIVNHDIIAFIYFDNINNRENKIQINTEFMKLLHKQISVAFYNARRYELLNRKNREIKMLDEMKIDFINIVSHELKTPLVNLKGYTERLGKIDMKNDNEGYIHKMQESVNILYHRTNDIVNYSRYNLINRIETNLTDISDIINILVDELSEMSKSRKMHFKAEVEENLPTIKINWEAFHLLISNIGINAIRFTKDFGDITIGARISAFQREEINGKPAVIIYVQDNGIGIPANELTNVFQKFYELNDLYSHKSGEIEYRSSGLGLGLATAKLITDLHKGKIWITSKENQGTTVFIAMPIS